jgi:hypothetical protein
MSAASRVRDFADGFDSYATGERLTDQPTWLGFGSASTPLVYNDPPNAIVYADAGADAIAMHERIYPLNQYAAFSVGEAVGGAGDYKGIGVTLRMGFSGSDYWYYYVVVSGTTNTVKIFRFDSQTGVVELASESISAPQVLDQFWCEIETSAAPACVINVYQDASETPIATANDATELTGTYMGVVVAGLAGIAAGTPSVYAVEFGHIDTEGLRSLDTVNPDGIVKSKGEIVLTGSGLSEIDSASISTAGANPYPVAILSQSAEWMTLAAIDIQQTKHTYGQLLLTLGHPTDVDTTKTFTMVLADGWQSVTLSGATADTLILTDTPAINGDTMEIPTSNGFSTFTLAANGDVTYDSAADQGMYHTRRLYQVSTASWDNGTVTINQVDAGSGELLPPSWRSVPAPPNCVVGTYYEYQIGYLLNGSRPMQLSQAPGSNSLPFGLNYNSNKNPETIEGTITSGSGTITVNNIITRATNGA